MNAETVIRRLHEYGVIEATGGDTFALTERFRSSVAAHAAEFEPLDGDTERLCAAVDFDERLVEQVAGNAALLARWQALTELAEFNSADAPQLLVFLTHVEEFDERTGGVPDPFTAVPGNRVAGLVNVHPRAVVYLWREECGPCDLVREWFETQFPDPPDDIALYAVYGPDWAKTLDERFGANVAPTTLFVVDGRVDCRHVGAKSRESLQREIENLRALSNAGPSEAGGGRPPSGTGES